MRWSVISREHSSSPEVFLGLLFCQKSECSAKGCRLAYLGWGEGFHLGGTTKAGDQTRSQPDTWRPQHQRRSEGPSAKSERALGGRVNSRGQQKARHRIEEDSSSNPASAHPTMGGLSYTGEQPKDQHRLEVTLQTYPHAISEVSTEEGTSERLAFVQKQIKYPKKMFNWKKLVIYISNQTFPSTYCYLANLWPFEGKIH